MSEAIIKSIEEPRATVELVGHEAAEHVLIEASRSGRLPHGWLIAGPKGVGKATLAWRFARFLLSEDATKANGDMSVDTTLPAVRQVIAGAHPDCRLVRRSHARTPPYRFRTQIVVEDIRDLGPFLRQTPAHGGWRVVIVDVADEMNHNAANALLKLLEEPPDSSVLVLVSHTPHELLPTIRSRCRTLALRPLSANEVERVLRAQRPALADADLGPLALLSDGSPGLAVTLADAGGLDLYREMIELLAPLPRLDVPRLHEIASRFGTAAGEGSFRIFARLLERWVAQLATQAARGGGSPPAELTAGEGTLRDRLLLARESAHWLEVWEGVTGLIANTDTANLDRKQVTLDLFFKLANAAAD